MRAQFGRGARRASAARRRRATPTDRRPKARGERGGGGGGGGGFGGGSAAAVSAAAPGRPADLFADPQLNLVDEVTIAPGVPELDYLHGEAIGSSGGRPRHEVEVQAG